MMERFNNNIKDDTINIKLEVCRDKTSNKLSIMAHFNDSAPNIFKENGEYYWKPTHEEKELLNEAFELIQFNKPNTNPNINTPEQYEINDIKVETEMESKIPEQKTEDMPPIENIDKSPIFGANSDDKENTSYEKNKEPPRDFTPTKNEETINLEEFKNPKEQKKPEIDEFEPNKSDIDKGLIVEADSEAIHAALNKYTEKDESIVEADEQTIIDRVISQKKKGKWSQR
jgi:hypothetical protein